MSTLNVVAQPDGLRKGITISQQSLIQVLVPESEQADESRLLLYRNLMKGSPAKDVEYQFRSLTKDEREAKKAAKEPAIAPLIEALMKAKGMQQASAANRVSEAKAIFNAYLQGLEVKATRWHEAVAEARAYLDTRKAQTNVLKQNLAVGELRVQMEQAVKDSTGAEPNAETLASIRQQAAEAIKVTQAQADAKRKFDNLKEKALEMGFYLIPTAFQQAVEVIYHTWDATQMVDALTLRDAAEQDQKDAIEGEHTVVEVAEMPKETA